MSTAGRRRSVRRKIAVATWRAPKEGRLHARMAVDATAVLAFCAEQRAATGTPVSPAAVVGLAFQRAVEDVPAFHSRVVFGRIVPFPSYDVAFAVDIDGGDDLAPTKVRAADTKTVGPAESFKLQWREDDPGTWLYHCHVESHMMAGMIGIYRVFAR